MKILDKPCLTFLVLCQFALIMPLTLLLIGKGFWMLPPTHMSRHLPNPAIFNLSGIMQEHGYAGPFSIFSEEELELIPKMHKEWEDFWGELRDAVVAEGFREPPKRDCFIWLPNCYKLAKHAGILQIVQAILGPNVLVHGMTFWQNESALLDQFHVDLETHDCMKGVNVLIGSNLIVIKHSQRLVAGPVIRRVADTIRSLNEKSLAKPLEERAQFIERVLVSVIKNFALKSDVHPVNLEIGVQDCIVFNNRAVYRTGKMIRGTSLLMQFVAAECKVRDVHSVSWGMHRMQKTLFMLPCLIASDDNTSYSINDVQRGLYAREGFIVEDSRPVELDAQSQHPSLMMNLSVFRAPTLTSTSYNKSENLRMHNYGIVSTLILPEVHLENSLFLEAEKDVKYKATAFEQIIIVLTGVLLYHRTVDNFEYHEVVELVEESAVFIASRRLHALTSASNGTSYVSIRWIGKELQVLDANSKDKQFAGSFVDAIEGRTYTLKSGQAYDPDNEDCDMILVMIKGSSFQILPSEITLQVSDVVLVPAGEPCLFWNVGRKAVTFFVTHLCRIENNTWNRNLGALAVFAASGKLM